MKHFAERFCVLIALSWVSLLCSAEGQWQVKSVDKKVSYKGMMPNLDVYNEQSFQDLMDRKNTMKGSVKLVRMFDQLSLSSFTAGERSIEWAARQRSHPQAIVVSGGAVSLKDIYETISDKRYIEKLADNSYLLRLPLVVERGGLLIADDTDVDELKLSLERGAFISVAGDLFTTNIKITAWSEDKRQTAYFERDDVFRPFIVAWSGGGVYMLRTVVSSLGYNYSKSYGMSFSKYTTAAEKKIKEPLGSPSGWLIDSVFEDMYFGFYCYETKNVAVVNNIYRNNIMYGIDPHDRSEGLIISGNDVYGTKKKHGIIASRAVNNSWIINNKIHHNNLSGIVLDRTCEHNFIGNNESYNNGGDGITLYESGHNSIFNNNIRENAHHGFRVRNSESVVLRDNNIILNGRTGILGHAEDLSDTDRDLNEDPYQIGFSLKVFGGSLAANASGAMRMDEPEALELSNVKILFPPNPNNILFRGFLREKTQDVLTALSQEDTVIMYRKKEEVLDSVHVSALQ